MVVSFVGFTFLLLVLLDQFVELADYIRLTTYYILLLFGFGFLTHHRSVQSIGALMGALFFLFKGWVAVIIAAIFGIVALEFSGRVALRIQQLGTDIQQKTKEEFGPDAPLSAFVVGLTLGLIWVPCAGPALGFAFTLVRDEPGFKALLALASYGMGTAIPLLAVGYGGQAAVHSVRALSRYTSIIKQIAGVLLILTAIALQFRLFERAQIWLLEHTNFGDLGTRIEEKLFQEDMFESMMEKAMPSSVLPKIARAPEFKDLGPWHNSEPFSLASLRGKVVLVDFWTYSCINCIRTLPFVQGYWERFRDTPFVLVGIHSPEFVFEKSPKNVAAAIARHGLMYPVAQDNDFGTWRAFANHYWPAKYLIDAQGYIRYTHFGEGAYEETEEAIRSLLAEIGVNVSGQQSVVSSQQDAEGRERTPETYLGSRSWPSLANGMQIPTDNIVSYRIPESVELHQYALVGDWQLQGDERQILRSHEGEIRMRFLGSEINLVLGLEEGVKPVNVSIEFDGSPPTQSFVVDHDDLYPLWRGDYGEHEIILHFSGPGISGYAFTFGS